MRVVCDICGKECTKTGQYQRYCPDCALSNVVLRVKQKRFRHKHPIKMMLARAKKRAVGAGLEFNLLEEDIKIPDKCPVLGTVLEWNYTNKRQSPSLDRVNNLKGYTKDNSRVISTEANALKRHYPIEVFERLVSYMKCEL